MARRDRGRRPAAPGADREQALREIGWRIRAARERAGITQEDAAGNAGIDYKRWQRLEQGTANPTAATLLRVAEAVETDLWHLLGPSRRSK